MRADGLVTIDLDTSDVEVYGRKKRGVAYNHQGRLARRAGVGYFGGQLALAAHDEHISFAMPGPYRYHG